MPGPKKKSGSKDPLSQIFELMPNSAATVAGALLQLALVLLDRGLVVTNPAKVRKDAGFGHRALETA